MFCHRFNPLDVGWNHSAVVRIRDCQNGVENQYINLLLITKINREDRLSGRR